MKPHRYNNPWRGRVAWLIAILVGIGGAAIYLRLHPEALPEWAARTWAGRQLQTTQVYKWRDTAGAWHVSDSPPPPGVAYTTEQYGRETNVLPLPPKLQR